MTEQLPIGAEPREATPALDRLIAEYVVARSRKEQLADELKGANQQEAIAEVRLFEAIEALGLRAVKSKEHGQFILSDLAWASTTDVERARDWLLAEMPEILTPNATKLAMIVREAIRGEREMPPGIEPKFTRRINWRKS